MQLKLQNLIQGTTEDLNMLVESTGGREGNYDVTMGQDLNSNPSPAGRVSTSTTRTGPDVLNINGWIRPFLHGGGFVDTTDYLRRMKATIEAQKYTIEELATITNADGVFLNMALRRLNWRRAEANPNEILVSMTWESLNIAGEIETPTFALGGLTG